MSKSTKTAWEIIQDQHNLILDSLKDMSATDAKNSQESKSLTTLLDTLIKDLTEVHPDSGFLSKSETKKRLKDFAIAYAQSVVPKEETFLWLAYNDNPDKERILNYDEYQKLEKEEGWKWSGHTIQKGYNFCRSQMLENIKKDELKS